MSGNNDVEVMQLMDYDPNTPPVDADQFTEEQQLTQDLAIRAEARYASFAEACRQLRADCKESPERAIDAFSERLVMLHMDGRVPLASTEQHSNIMQLLLKAALANLVISQDPDRP